MGHADYKVYVKKGEKPPPPKQFEIQGYGNDSFDINLGPYTDASNDSMRIKQYRFELMRKDDFEENGSIWRRQNIKDVHAKPGVTYLVTDLQPNTTYILRVASMNVAGISDWSVFKEFTTLTNAAFKGFAAKNFMNQFLFLATIFLLVRE